MKIRQPEDDLAFVGGKEDKKKIIKLFFTIFFLLIFVFVLGFWLTSQKDKNMRDELLKQTQFIAQTFHIEDIHTLRDSNNDTTLSIYKNTKEKLIELRETNKKFKFIYLLARSSDGSVFFLVDSEPSGSVDESPAGQVYDEASDDLKNAFDTQGSLVEGPISDRWGTWISSVIPIIDPDTHELIAMLGIDMDAGAWRLDVFSSIALPLGLIISLALLLLSKVVVTSSAATATIKPVQHRLLIPLGIISFVLVCFFVAVVVRMQEKTINDEYRSKTQLISQVLDKEIIQRLWSVFVAYETISSHTKWNELMSDDILKKNRQELLGVYEDVFNQLKEKYFITHLTILDSNRVNKLRIHNPDVLGGQNNHYAVLEAERTKNFSWGVETDVTGKLFVYAAQPLIKDGSVKGYVEFGRELDSVLKGIYDEYGFYIVFSTESNNTDSAENDYSSETIKENQKKTLFYSASSIIPYEVRELIANYNNNEKSKSETKTNTDTSVWKIFPKPIENIFGSKTHNIFIVKDITDEERGFNRSKIFVFSGSFIVLFFLLSVLYVVLGRTDKNIRAQRMVLERIKNAVDGSNDAVSITDITGGHFYQNETFNRLFGYSYSEIRSLGISVLYKERLKAQNITELIHKDGFFRGEVYMVSKEDKEIPIYLRINKVYDSNNQYIGNISIYSDITDRKEAEKRINKNLEQQKMLADISVELNQDKDFSYTMNNLLKKIGDQVHCSSSFIFEDSKDGLFTSNVFEWCSKDVSPFMCKKQNIEYKKIPSLLRFFDKDGSLMSDNVSGLPDDIRKELLHKDTTTVLIIPLKIKNKRIGFIGFNKFFIQKHCDASEINLLKTIASEIASVYERRRNIAEISEKTELIQKEKNKVETIIRGIGDGVFVVDSDLRIILFNPVASAISGYTEEEAIGQKYYDVLKFVFEIDPTRVNNIFIRDAMRMGKTQEMSNHTLLFTKKGTYVPVADSAAPLKDENGNIMGCVVVFRDTTREREIDKMKTEFVSVASHQLKTPLTGIKWMSELLLNEKLNKKQKEYIKDVYTSADRLSKLINDLLNVSHIETGRKFDIEKKYIVISDLIDDVIDMNKKFAKQKSIILSKKIEVSSQSIGFFDNNKMKQALNNLVDNAIKYSKNKGKVLFICKYDKKNDEIEITIKDSGIGIPLQQQKRLFEKFFRADNATQFNTDGTGLGLYITKAIIEAHGGKIWFESKEDKGTMFYVRLPLNKK